MASSWELWQQDQAQAPHIQIASKPRASQDSKLDGEIEEDVFDQLGQAQDVDSAAAAAHALNLSPENTDPPAHHPLPHVHPFEVPLASSVGFHSGSRGYGGGITTAAVQAPPSAEVLCPPPRTLQQEHAVSGGTVNVPCDEGTSETISLSERHERTEPSSASGISWKYAPVATDDLTAEPVAQADVGLATGPSPAFGGVKPVGYAESRPDADVSNGGASAGITATDAGAQVATSGTEALSPGPPAPPLPPVVCETDRSLVSLSGPASGFAAMLTEPRTAPHAYLDRGGSTKCSPREGIWGVGNEGGAMGGEGPSGLLVTALRSASAVCPTDSSLHGHAEAAEVHLPSVGEAQAQPTGPSRHSSPASKRPEGGFFGLLGRRRERPASPMATGAPSPSILNLARSMASGAPRWGAHLGDPSATDVAAELLRLEQLRLQNEQGHAGLRGEVEALREGEEDLQAELVAIQGAYTALRAERDDAHEQLEDLHRLFVRSLQDVVLLQLQRNHHGCASVLLLFSRRCFLAVPCSVLCVAMKR
jgi:hypothetical protein